MARRAFLPSSAPTAVSSLPPRTPQAAPASARASVAPPSQRGSIAASLNDARGPVSGEAVATSAVVLLLDRLLDADEAEFLVSWTDQLLAARARLDPTVAVRLLRAYRETGRTDKARELSASLPSAPSWGPTEAIRLAIERCLLCTIDGRADHAEAELRQANRIVGTIPRGQGLREQLDLHLASAQLELRLDRAAQALAALRLAEHVCERLEEGPWRVPTAMTFGHLAMRLADPRAAAKHYAMALDRSPARGLAALRANGNLAIALGSVGQFDAARANAEAACRIALEIAPGWRHADAYDVLAVVELAADRPEFALRALDDAGAALGDVEQPALRFALALHRALALAMMGRADSAKIWVTKAEKLRLELARIDPVDEQDLVLARARAQEAAGEPSLALETALTHAQELPDSFATGSLNLVLARCAQAVGDPDLARTALERAALAGARHGWIFADREASSTLWQEALKGGDSRIVRYAEKVVELLAGGSAPVSLPPWSTPYSTSRVSFAPLPPPSRASFASLPAGSIDDPDDDSPDSEALIYVTTPEGVTRVRANDVRTATESATLTVDTITHQLRIEGREVSLERRRALEPLVVQLLRRAREGLSAEEILRAAGGPGPESADAEHRVRVLISRVRDLLGDASAIERVRDAGEHGRTRYRLAQNIRFALVEPLYTS